MLDWVAWNKKRNSIKQNYVAYYDQHLTWRWGLDQKSEVPTSHHSCLKITDIAGFPRYHVCILLQLSRIFSQIMILSVSYYLLRCLILLIKPINTWSLHQILPRKEICIIPGHKSVLTTSEEVPDYFLYIAQSNDFSWVAWLRFEY